MSARGIGSNRIPTRPRALRRRLAGLGVAYVVTSLIATAAPGHEIFPFFCWFLFPVVPGAEPRYELYVDEVEGTAISPARNFQELGWVKDPKAMDLWVATQRMGRALDEGDDAEVARARRLIEASHLCAPSEWRIDRVRFDPLERWRTGQVDERVTIGVFSSQTRCGHAPWGASRADTRLSRVPP